MDVVFNPETQIFMTGAKPTDCVGFLTINNNDTGDIKFKINLSHLKFEAEPNYGTVRKQDSQVIAVKYKTDNKRVHPPGEATAIVEYISINGIKDSADFADNPTTIEKNKFSIVFKQRAEFARYISSEQRQQEISSGMLSEKPLTGDNFSSYVSKRVSWMNKKKK